MSIGEITSDEAPWLLSREVVNPGTDEEYIRVRTAPHACTGCGRVIRWARATCFDCGAKVMARG